MKGSLFIFVFLFCAKVFDSMLKLPDGLHGILIRSYSRIFF